MSLFTNVESIGQMDFCDMFGDLWIFLHKELDLMSFIKNVNWDIFYNILKFHNFSSLFDKVKTLVSEATQNYFPPQDKRVTHPNLELVLKCHVEVSQVTKLKSYPILRLDDQVTLHLMLIDLERKSWLLRLGK